ncbi:CamS family sex pheromone protein [Sporosarcina siberiensis]|uniref:CamS family sex pheromone protein n=1 Tax=Sporosarcina siberiensis TaxID=1365606 RepID=A0ABW4SE33_9BACL
MKKMLIIPGLVAVVLISGCLPSIDKKEEVLQDNEQRVEEMVVIPSIQIKEEYYRSIIPFKESASRGYMGSTNTKYDVREAEEGLLRLSLQKFDPKNHFFQEGQFIDETTVKSWLGRKSETNTLGLNPETTDEMTEAEIASQAPSYLARIVEQNYLVLTDEKKLRLAGISIGLSLNSVHYTRSGEETKITKEALEAEGMEMGEEIIRRIRSQEGLKDIPIVIGLFKQESRNSIVPGSYFATTTAEKGKDTPSGWKIVDEEHVLFPASTNDEKYRDLDTSFKKFKQEIDNYFPSFVNVIGRGLYKDGSIKSLSIEIPIQFFGTSETIGFTQYITSLIKDIFPNIDIEASVTSVNGAEALIVKEAGNDEPYVHIYGY